MNEKKVRISRSAYGNADVVVYNLPSIKMVDFFSLLDVWGSKGYDRFDDGGLYFEVPMFVYENIENIQFLKTSGILIEKF